MDEDPEQPVHPSDRLHAVKGAPDGSPDRSQHHRDDQGHEHAQHGREVQQLLHLIRVLLVEPKNHEQCAEEKDLGHQRLDYAALESGDERDHQHQDDEDVDDHRSGAILDDGPRNPFLPIFS